MQQHSSKYFVRRPPPPRPPPPLTLGVRSKGQNSTFLKHGHVAYQFKGNHKCSKLVANILPADPNPHDSRDQKVQIQLFQDMVILYFKLNRITNVATW